MEVKKTHGRPKIQSKNFFTFPLFWTFLYALLLDAQVTSPPEAPQVTSGISTKPMDPPTSGIVNSSDLLNNHASIQYIQNPESHSLAYTTCSSYSFPVTTPEQYSPVPAQNLAPYYLLQTATINPQTPFHTFTPYTTSSNMAPGQPLAMAAQTFTLLSTSSQNNHPSTQNLATLPYPFFPTITNPQKSLNTPVALWPSLPTYLFLEHENSRLRKERDEARHSVEKLKTVSKSTNYFFKNRKIN